MNKEEKLFRELLKAKGYDADRLFSSDVLDEKERKEQLASILADIVKSQSNNSTKLRKVEHDIPGDEFHLGFVSDAHSRLYLLEQYLDLLDSIGGKCVVTGDITNGSNHFHGHDSSLKETLNLTNDILTASDVMNRHKDMFIGYVEGNHDQWITEGTSLLVGYIACKFAGIDSIYAKNVQLVTQNVTKDGKKIPFNFLIVHGEGIPADIINGLKKSIGIACKQNVDAIIFGHTHKMGSASAVVLKKNGKGDWIENQVTSYNPGSLLEASDYADKAGYPENTPFDGTIMHCSVVPTKDGKGYKKCIDLQNIMEVVDENDRKLLKALKNKLNVLESKRYESKKEIQEMYGKLLSQYTTKNVNVENVNGHYFIGISGVNEMFSNKLTKDIKQKIKEDLTKVVEVAERMDNVSVVLNGDFVFDYNKGYIAKKDYCANTIADIQDLCEILKPISNKIVAINNGKMEQGIMNVEMDKGNGRWNNKKKDVKELANYATQILQLDEKLAYAPYDKQEMYQKQLAIQNDEVNKYNQKVLDKAYDDCMKRMAKDVNDLADLDKFVEKTSKKGQSFDKKIKEALVKKLREEHKILDISRPEDKEKIEEICPLTDIDLRMPNQNLIGNIVCKMLDLDSKDVKVNPNINFPTTFKVKDANGKTKTVQAYYCTSAAKCLRELPAKLTAGNEPPDVVLINNYTSPSSADLQEFTTQIRVSYFNKMGVKKVKDIPVINSGSYAYSKYLMSGKIPTNMVYKVANVTPIFNTLIPKDSTNYAGKNLTRPVVEKYTFDSVLNNEKITTKMIVETTKKSMKNALEKFDKRNANIENSNIIDEAINNFDMNIK